MLMKKTTILLFSIFFLTSTFAQNYTKKYSSLSFPSNGYYSLHKSGSYATSDNGTIFTSGNGTNLNVNKTSNTGCLQWSFDYDFGVPSKGCNVKPLLDGNYLVCGTVDNATLAMKIDPTGNVIWAKTYDALYAEPADFAQNGGEVMILAGQDLGYFPTNYILIKIDQSNGNLLDSKIINRVPLETTDVNLLCRFTRILSIPSGYVLGGYTVLNKNFTDPLAPTYKNTPVEAFLDLSGNLLVGAYFTEGEYVADMIQNSSGQLIIAIENHDLRYIPALPVSQNRLTILKTSFFSILWQKTYVSPASAVALVANQLPKNMEFTSTGDILISGFVDQYLASLAYAGGDYIFKINGNGNILTDLLVFNNTYNGVGGLNITPTNEFVMNLYNNGMKRFNSNLLTSLCGYTSIPLNEYDDVVTSIVITGMTEVPTPVNVTTVSPVKTISSPIVTTICGTPCPTPLPCYGNATTGLTAGLLAYYPFGDGSINDYSGNGHHLTNITTAHPTADRNGNVNCAYNFTKANNEFLAQISPAFLDNITHAPFSIALWYQPLGTRPIGDYELLLGRDVGLHCPETFGQWSVGLLDCRKAFVGFDMKSVWQTSTVPDCNTLLSNISNNWHHLAFVYDGTTSNLYVDGILYNNVHGPCGSLSANIGNLFLGKKYTGDLDDIFIYNRALSTTEINQIFTLGSSCCNYSTLTTTARLCSNPSTTDLSSNLIGTNYSWQVNNGSGYENVIDNSNYSGSSTSTLHLQNMPTSYYGYEYRCNVDGNYSDPITIKFSNTWTGAIDKTWENPGNWSCGVIPDGNTDVSINTGTVTVNSSAACRSINLNSGIKFYINPSFKLNVTNGK